MPDSPPLRQVPHTVGSPTPPTTRTLSAKGTSLSNRRQLFAGSLALLTVNLLVFWPVLGFDFVRWDDDINITRNPLLQAPWSWDLLRQLFGAEQALRFKPLYWLLCRAQSGVFGLSPGAWHACSLALQAGSAVLGFLVLQELLSRWRRDDSASVWFAWLGAALWSVHPLRAEVVGWATGETYSLATCWLLAALLCYLQAQKKRGWPWLLASWVLAAGSFSSYPIGLAFGLWLAGLDWWLNQLALEADKPKPLAPVLPGLIRIGGFLLPATFALVPTLWARYTTPGIFTQAPDLDSIGLPLRLLSAFANLGALVRQFIWPSQLTPNLPPLNLHGTTLLDLFGLAAIACLLIGWVLLQRREYPTLAFVVIGFACLSVPCLGLTERPNWPVDRYSYLVDWVLVGGLAGAMAALPGRLRWIAAGLGGAVLLVLAVASRQQLSIWQNSETLFRHMEQHPRFADHPRQQAQVYILRANAEGEAGHPDRAAAHFNRARQICLSAIQRALIRYDYQEAISLLGQVERFFPLSPELRRERASWQLQAGRPDLALPELTALEPLLPADPRRRELESAARRVLAEAHP